ncbi:hypothetical protein MHYP_G00263410 [Metynnis hypsauchen]
MASKGLKRPKRYEVNNLPDLPDRQKEDSLEAARKVLVEEMKKRNPSATVIGSKMDQTLPLRRPSSENIEGTMASSFYRKTSVCRVQ